MKRIQNIAILLILLISIIIPVNIVAQNETDILESESSYQYENGYRYNIQGWIYTHIEGDAYERGYQHGYLLSAEIIDSLNRWMNTIHKNPKINIFNKLMSEERYKKVSNTWWNFCVNNCYRMYWNKFPIEYQEEIKGIADGVNARGGTINGRDVNFKDILAMNEMYEFMSKMTRKQVFFHPLRKLVHQLENILPDTEYVDGDALYNSFFDGEPPHHCNGFIASGNATTDGQLVFTHSTICGGGSWWWNYYVSLRWNVMLDIQPTNGNRIIIPTSPGFIWSDEDYYQNDNGIVFLETTNSQGIFDNRGLPLCVRARSAVQYGNSIDDVIYNLRNKNDGSMNAVWLIGDTKTGEICRFELGYRAYAVYRQYDGYYWSANNPYNLRVRFEKFNLKEFVKRSVYPFLGISGFGYFAIRYRPELRDIKYEELGEQYYGEIDIDVVKEISSTSPISDWITDIKLTDSNLLKENGIWAFFGNPHKVLNITNYDNKIEMTRQVHPCGWVRFFGLPDKDNFSLIHNQTQYDEDSKIIWTLDTKKDSNYYSSNAVIKKDILYVSDSYGNLYSIDASSGNKIWDVDIGENPTVPVIEDDHIFIGYSKGLKCLDTNGNIKWQKSSSDVLSPPVLIDNKVIFGDKIGNIVLLDVSSGEELFRLSFSDEIYISKFYDNNIYAATGKSCYAIDIENQNISWSYNTFGMITSEPVLQENRIFLNSWDNNIYVLNSSNGDLIWKYEAGWGFDSSPAVSSDIVFTGSCDNNLYALNVEDGSLEWIFSTNAAIHSNPVVFGEYVFFGSDDGRFYAVNKTNGDPEWIFSPEFTIDNDVINFITTPIISDSLVNNSIVYLGVNGTIYALDAQTVESIVDDVDDDNNNDPNDQEDNQSDDQNDGDLDDENDNKSSEDNFVLYITIVIFCIVVMSIFIFLYLRK